MMFKLIIPIFLLHTNFITANKNLQTFSFLKSKQIDCGTVQINEDFEELTSIYTHEDILKRFNLNEDDNIDDEFFILNDENEHNDSITKLPVKRDDGMKIIANLSSCINEQNELYASYSTRLTTRLINVVFSKYFHLDEKNGLVYLRKRMDREKFCVQVNNFKEESASKIKPKLANKLKLSKQPNKMNSLLKRSISSDYPTSSEKSSSRLQDYINCDCESERCEIKFKFIAFKKRSKSNQNEMAQNQKKEPLSNHKQLSLTIKLNDLNDNNPKFSTAFLYLNTTEYLSSKLNANYEYDVNVNPSFNKAKKECSLVQTYLNNQNYKNKKYKKQDQEGFNENTFLNFNSLIPIEKAFDLDVGVNAEISYRLIYFNNTSSGFIDSIERERDVNKREALIRHALKYQVGFCNSSFELIESNLREYSSNLNSDLQASNSSKNYEPISDTNQALLFLKINAYLDREMQEVYNFILIAKDKNKLENTKNLHDLISHRNYLLIKLVVNDLNDNQPIFTEPKYVFSINESTEFDKHFSNLNYLKSNDENNENEYYRMLLNATCSSLKSKIKVKANDADAGLNSLVKYKIIQQIHRKNSNFKPNNQPFHPFNVKNALHRANDQTQFNPNSFGHNPHNQIAANLDPDSLFHIDELDGSIYLAICKSLNTPTSKSSLELSRIKYLELISLLDYESYVKHILVIEATDSSTYNPLQTVVTLEINLIDLNDNPPFLISVFNLKCAKYGSQLDYSENLNDLNRLRSGVNISVQHFNSNFNINHQLEEYTNHDGLDRPNYASKVVIDGLSEYYRKGDCVAQFLISDLDTNKQNRRLDVFLAENKEIDYISPLMSSPHFTFSSLKNRKSYFDKANRSFVDGSKKQRHEAVPPQVQTNEIFELFLDFDPDAEQQKSFDLTLVVSDNGHPIKFTTYIQFLVNIKDENDNKPIFTKSFYNFTIDEWSEFENTTANIQDYCFGRVEAHDFDVSEENSVIYYDLSGLEADNKYRIENSERNYQKPKKSLTKNVNTRDLKEENFYINQKNGDICVKNRKLIDRETKSRYEFLVRASNSKELKDHSNPHETNSSTAYVHINIRDLNDNKPEFLQKKYTFYVSEQDSNLVDSYHIFDNKDSSNEPGMNKFKTLVGNVVAFDNDIGSNADLEYYILDNEPDFKSYFELNTDNVENPFLADKSSKYMTDDELFYGLVPSSEKQLDEEDALLSSSEQDIIYKVTAIRHAPSMDFKMNLSNDSFEYSFDLLPKNNTNENLLETKSEPSYFSQTRQNKKRFKKIESLSEYIYVNSSTGSVYLINRIDREQIVSIRFYIFVSDRKTDSLLLGSDPSLAVFKSFVPVTIEIEDINDSKPVCQSSEYYLNQMNQIKAIDVYSILIDLGKINLNDLVLPEQAGNAKLFSHLIKIYQFECVDNDKNKNAELKYEIERFYLKSMDRKYKKKYNKNKPGPKKLNKQTTMSEFQIESLKYAIVKRNSLESIFSGGTPISLYDTYFKPNSNLVNKYFSRNKIISLNSNNGNVYLNISNSWIHLSENNSIYVNQTFLSYIENRFLVIKIKVSDKGIVPLYNYYYLKLYFCIKRAKDESGLEKIKFCNNFEIDNQNENETSSSSFVSIKSLMSADYEIGDVSDYETKSDVIENLSSIQSDSEEVQDSHRISGIDIESNYNLKNKSKDKSLIKETTKINFLSSTASKLSFLSGRFLIALYFVLFALANIINQ